MSMVLVSNVVLGDEHVEWHSCLQCQSYGYCLLFITILKQYIIRTKGTKPIAVSTTKLRINKRFRGSHNIIRYEAGWNTG